MLAFNTPTLPSCAIVHVKFYIYRKKKEERKVWQWDYGGQYKLSLNTIKTLMSSASVWPQYCSPQCGMHNYKNVKKVFTIFVNHECQQYILCNKNTIVKISIVLHAIHQKSSNQKISWKVETKEQEHGRWTLCLRVCKTLLSRGRKEQRSEGNVIEHFC